MKTINDEIWIPLFNLSNISFNIIIFPNTRKFARVLLESKNEAGQQCNNYRPIFLLSNIGKMIEKLMHVRLNQFLESATTPLNLVSVLIFRLTIL